MLLSRVLVLALVTITFGGCCTTLPDEDATDPRIIMRLFVDPPGVESGFPSGSSTYRIEGSPAWNEDTPTYPEQFVPIPNDPPAESDVKMFVELRIFDPGGIEDIRLLAVGGDLEQKSTLANGFRITPTRIAGLGTTIAHWSGRRECADDTVSVVFEVKPVAGWSRYPWTPEGSCIAIQAYARDHFGNQSGGFTLSVPNGAVRPRRDSSAGRPPTLRRHGEFAWGPTLSIGYTSILIRGRRPRLDGWVELY